MTLPFWEDGYQLVEGLLDQDKLALASAAMDHSSASGLTKLRTDPAVGHAEDEYSPRIGDMLLAHCQPAIEAVVGRALIGSYAYWRIYREGGVMQRHRDRAASEVAVSIGIGTEPGTPDWPLRIQDLHGKEMAIVIPPGAGLVYQGHAIEHWRDRLDTGAQRQLFIFYVFKDGEFANHAGDRIEVPVSRWGNADD
ncbi:hypothetical protein [Erythrobacter sp. JK5]|uniref:hypothetical protein n=1 Tax=Erythrobacter sp. JK5 TaxID=2829500 RepID=UPI001BA657B9|nr:hypothetical protein [Erythrobacter sp. JK5]QUL38313.1 hypothetical protein KDC96_02535 [Erythrobacter sp. JK5]